jgi:hypothetical protein
VRHRLPWLGLFALDLLSLWVVTSLLRGKGLLAFAAGVAALSWAVVRARQGATRPLFASSFLLMLGALAVLGTEAALRLHPGLLQGRAANAAFGGYHDERDGIYDHHERLGCVMRPEFRRHMYWNGQWWWHETNEAGYRGPRLAQADALFLGDSMIYGHGVEVDDTVPARFAAASGRPAANLGQQGTCLVQGLMLLSSRGARLRPKVVFVCPHPNDLKDASYWYEPDELRRFVADDRYLPYARREFRGPEAPFAFWLRHVALPLATARALRAVGTSRGPTAPAEATSGRVWLPPAAMLDAPFAPDAEGELVALGWQAQKRALVRLKQACDTLGARLVVFDLGYPHALSRAVEAAALDTGATYDPIGRRVLARALAGEEMYQRDDGHWTPAAAEVIGRALASSFPASGAGGP